MVKRKASKQKASSANKKVKLSTVRKIVKKALLRTAETKYNSNNAENFQLYHNGGTGLFAGYVVRPNMLGTLQGQTEERRLGDKVQAVSCQIRLWLANKNDRPNVTYRVMVVAVPPDQVSTSALLPDFFEGDIGNKILDPINTNKYKVIKEKFIQVSGQDTAWTAGDILREKSKSMVMSIKLKGRTVSYRTEGSTEPKLQRDCLTLVVLAYDAFGTLTTDNIASLAYSQRFYFKDI